MKIAVCVKQVPVLSRIKFDYESKTIVREGVPLEVNTFDMLAVDRAAALAREIGAEVVVFTMGPPQARDALVQCLAMGADRAIHLTDRAMAGSDTLATARSLSLTLKRAGFDTSERDWLVFCGRNSTDAETGQVGPELAELLQIPHVGNVHNLDYFGDKKKIVVERATDEGYEVIECPLPALVSVTEGIMAERFPSRQELEAARASPDIEEVAAAQLSSDSSLFGAAGSPTWVSEIRLIEPSRLGHVIEEADPHVAAKMVVDIVERRSVTAAPVEVAGPRLRYRGQRDMAIWVLAERLGSGLRRATFELLGKARELAERTRGEVSAIVMGPAQEDDLRSLGAYGADRVLVLGSTDLGHPAGLAATAAFSEAIGAHSPYAVLVPSTVNGRDLASRVAARLGLGLTGDCVDLEINEGGELVQLKPALGGNIIAPIRSRTRPYMATLRPGLLTALEPDWDQKAEVEILEVPAAAGGADIVLLESHSQQDVMGVELETAQVVLGVGMGVGGPENLPTVYKLARSLGASVAATRNVTDAGWLPKQLQVGLTGRAIAPELYLAVGVRGDFNHTVGLQKAGTILAINVNPNPRRAPILQAADVSIIGDWETYLPPLVEALVPLVESRATKVRG